MKTLVENSITFKGIGRVQAKTIFNSVDRTASKYFDISNLAGERIFVEYSYTEEEALKTGSLSMVLAKSLTEEEVRDAILAQIQVELI